MDDKLEHTRFKPTKESLALLETFKEQLPELQLAHPDLVGFAFFGSRTQGKEEEHSDLDIVTFVDSSGQSISNRKVRYAELDTAVTAIIRSRITDPKPGQINFKIDISPEAVDDNLNDIYKFVHGEIDGTTAYYSFFSIASQFMLAVGDDVIKSRDRILRSLESHEDGEKIFSSVIEWLGDFERHEEKGVPPYGHYPTTIAEARSYFVPARLQTEAA